MVFLGRKEQLCWQCFDDFVKKQRETSAGVTLTLEAQIHHMFSSLSSHIP